MSAADWILLAAIVGALAFGTVLFYGLSILGVGHIAATARRVRYAGIAADVYQVTGTT